MRLASLIALLALSLHADVTLRYKSAIQMNSSLPPAMVQQATQGMTNGMIPTDITVLMKNGKGYSSAGFATSIVDFTKQQVTMLDKDGKRYATLPAKDLADQIAAAMPAMPDQAKAIMASMKSHFASKATGASQTFSGIDSEERQIEISIDAPPMPNVPPGPMMRMVMHVWTAKSSEIMKNPAIREMAGYNLFSIATMNPVGSLEKMFQSMPGFADAFQGMMKDLQSGGTPVVTRMQIEMFMPMIAAMVKQNPQAAAMFGNFDGESPLMTMTQEIAELSTAAVPESSFQIPEGYKEAPALDVLKAMFSKAEANAKGAAAGAPGAPKQ